MRLRSYAPLVLLFAAGCSSAPEMVLENLHWTIDAPREKTYATMEESVKANGETPISNTGSTIKYQTDLTSDMLSKPPTGDAVIAKKYEGGKLSMVLERNRQIMVKLSTAGDQNYMKISINLADDETGKKTVVTSEYDSANSGLPEESENRIRDMLFRVPLMVIDKTERQLKVS